MTEASIYLVLHVYLVLHSYYGMYLSPATPAPIPIVFVPAPESVPESGGRNGCRCDEYSRVGLERITAAVLPSELISITLLSIVQVALQRMEGNIIFKIRWL